MIDRITNSINFQHNRLKYILIFLLVNTAGFFYYLYYLVENGYLPSPFLYDKTDTFMDLFNTMYWAFEDGRYSEWGSVYPPLGFLMLRLVNFIFGGSRFGSASYMRDHSIIIIYAFELIYLISPVFVLRTKCWKEFLWNEKILIYFVMILSTPMLFALERGNLIVLAPIFLALALSNIGFVRALSIALLINIKPYFFLLLIYYLVRKNWKGFITCSAFSGLIFLITGLALDNHFLYFFLNLLNFSQDNSLFSLREVMSMPSSISAFTYILKNPTGILLASHYLGQSIISNLPFLIEVSKWSILGFAIATLILGSNLFRDVEVFCLLIVFITNLGVWVGGYSFIFYISLVPIFLSLSNKRIYIVILFIIAMPLDVISLMQNSIGNYYSYLTDSIHMTNWSFGLGSIFRPISNLLLLLILSCELFSRKHVNFRKYLPCNFVDSVKLNEKELNYVK